MASHVAPASAPSSGSHAPDPIAGVLCGLIAGAAYLVAQMLLVAVLLPGTGWEPLQRMSSLLLGGDAAPVYSELSLTTGGIGLMIHFGLSMVYGRLVEWLTRSTGVAGAVLRGAAIGAALYVVNYWLIAPVAFPWMEAARNAVTAADHVLFGAVAGLACQLLRRRTLLRPA